MAFITIENCIRCKQRTSHINGQCAQCKKTDEQVRREQLRAKRASMTIEERIEAIEEWIDNFHAHNPFNPLKL